MSNDLTQKHLNWSHERWKDDMTVPRDSLQRGTAEVYGTFKKPQANAIHPQLANAAIAMVRGREGEGQYPASIS